MSTPQPGQDQPYGPQPQYQSQGYPSQGYPQPSYPPPGYSPAPGYPPPPYSPQGPPGPPPRKRRGRRVLLVVAGVVGLFVVLGVIGALVGGNNSGHPAAVASSIPAAAAVTPTTAPPPAPTPSPNGTYNGSCDYTLGNTPDAQNWLVGEVDVTNTGNVGTVVRARISWPQEGYSPITARKTVRVAAGATVPVRFHVPAGSITSGSNVIDLLQSYQSSHNGTGCTYHATIASTYGQPG